MITSSMIAFLSVVFRYFFVFYVIYFLWQGITFILIERGKIIKSQSVAIIKQKTVIIFLHVKAFFVLSASSGEIDTRVLTYGGYWLVLFLVHGLLVKKIYRNTCPLIWNGFFFLSSIGSITLTRLSVNLASRQLLWLLVSLCVILMLPVAIKILRKLEKYEYLYLGLGLSLLISTSIFGTEEFGAVRWIQIGDFGFSPAEAVSFTYILYIATVFRKKLVFKQLIFPTFMAVLHVVILVWQRNLGAALIFFFTYMIVMYIATGRILLFFLGFAFFTISAIFSYEWFDHVQVRVAVWNNPWEYVHGIGFQTIQSFFAVGTWGWAGSGLGLGIPGVVPVVARDLTFAAIGEEMGWLFALGVIGVYIMLFYRGMHVALRCKRRYYSLIAVGFTGVLAFQTFLIIAGTLNFAPLTGVTLPFISYGGSSFLVSTVMIGMLQWVFSRYGGIKRYHDEETEEEIE